MGCRLALHRLPGIGSGALADLLQRFGSAQQVYEARRGDLVQACGNNQAAVEAILAGPDKAVLERDLAWLEEDDHHLIAFDDPAYPPLLRELSDPPALLFVCGNLGVLARPQVAMVGSRNPTPTGLDNALAFARHLAESGLVVTSGLALGIDGAAHRGALEGAGGTVAVTGTGVDRIYPARHHELAHRIAARGALVSEFPLGSPPLRENFPRRNRIISGLSIGTVVVEAALKSGSLITARLAAEQGREVFAIPGSIHSPLSRGCHALIREGAKLVETAWDILEELGPLASVAWSGQEHAGASEAGKGSELEPEMQRLLQELGYEPITLEKLIERTGLTAGLVSSMLLRMELHGLVVASPGGTYVRVP